MLYRRHYYAAYRPLDAKQRRRLRGACLALAAVLLIGLARESVFAPPPAVAVPGTAACVARGVELAVCVDVARTHGDFRY